MQPFWKELFYTDVHFRDDWQFEVEADFAPITSSKESTTIQEFYFYLPQGLQVDSESYLKEQFYVDRTNLIRFKTPEFSLQELCDHKNDRSPLYRIRHALHSATLDDEKETIDDELKLFANVFRSSIRRNVRDFFKLVQKAKTPTEQQECSERILSFCSDIKHLRKVLLDVKAEFFSIVSDKELRLVFSTVDEFCCGTIEHFLTGFLEYVRRFHIQNLNEIDTLLCEILLDVQNRGRTYFSVPHEVLEDPLRLNEYILFRRGQLNKFVLDALLLNLRRTSLVQRYGGRLATLAASLAMLIYVSIITLQVLHVEIGALTVILITVGLYTLKEQLKDWLKDIFHKQARVLFSDYTTEIRSPSGRRVLGKIKEFFSFLTPSRVPEDVSAAENAGEDLILPHLKVPKTIIYYKKEVVLQESDIEQLGRRKTLHNILLFNIFSFMKKASNPTEPSFVLDFNSFEIGRKDLPKVYHIDIILKTTTKIADEEIGKELKKFRIVATKSGILRIEEVHL